MTDQATLSSDQIAAFYHDEFVMDQVVDFKKLVPDAQGVIADIGGGCGFFARALSDAGHSVRVLDSDPVSVEACEKAGVPAILSDALRPDIRGDEGVASFNLILHHLIGVDEKATRALQVQALKVWRTQAKTVFVNEYIYDPLAGGDISGSLIYFVTQNKFLARVILQLAKFIPAFRANTLGTGVRFRSHAEWQKLFKEAGYRMVADHRGKLEPISAFWRVFLIKQIRRDSFRLEPT